MLVLPLSIVTGAAGDVCACVSMWFDLCVAVAARVLHCTYDNVDSLSHSLSRRRTSINAPREAHAAADVVCGPGLSTSAGLLREEGK